MAYEVGKLRHRVTFQAHLSVQDETYGGLTAQWRNVFEDVPAAIEPITAREFLAGQSRQSAIIARITVRYRPGLDASQLIKHGTTIYNIEGILPDKDSGVEFVTIPCSAGVNDG